MSQPSETTQDPSPNQTVEHMTDTSTKTTLGSPVPQINFNYVDSPYKNACLDHKKWLLQQPLINYLSSAINTLITSNTDNHAVSIKDIVQCIQCPEKNTNSLTLFDAESNETLIGLCENNPTVHPKSTRAVSHLAHEFIHVYDHIRVQFDPNNPQHHACTEIRAAALSGQCSLQVQQTSGYISEARGYLGAFERCVRRDAWKSMSFLPLCQNEEQNGHQCQNAFNTVFERCIQDKAPLYTRPDGPLKSSLVGTQY